MAEYITSDPLPLSQNFKSLKEEGLTLIQQYSNANWTNLNPSDPGITILDQVCFALTELGYCNEFKIEDILAESNEQLPQFYLPEDILTSSPVTCTDYIKYLIDGVDNVQNALVVSAGNADKNINGMYQVYLLVDQSLNNPEAIHSICLETFFYLNAARNLGETFGMPRALLQVEHFITCIIEIADATQAHAIIASIDQNIRHFIFPLVVPSGYQQLIADGFDINQGFNGPLLRKGWIPMDHLGKKKNQLRVVDIYNLIKAVPGVISVSDVTLDSGTESQVTSQLDELLVIDLEKSLQEGLQFFYKGASVTPGSEQLRVNPSVIAESIVQPAAAQQVQSAVPPGKYRDINSYYSIQNTFPETFAVGADAAYSNTTDFQIAQSRQLKGYLTLFDQILANQFSQLANIGRLFSFKNSLTGTPSDEQKYYAFKDEYEREHQQYPAAYLRFASTYFYQSLYDVPYIRPLLKDFDSLRFGPGLESEKEQEHQSWLKYKEDPYNPYIWGLMQIVDDDRNSLERREAILDHLLARHGESPVMIDTMIDGSVYTGDTLKDRVIFKSLFLQNLGGLSYYRQKAYNYLAAGSISATLESVPENFEKKILGGYLTDFIFNSAKIDECEKLTEPDFVNYSALELKLCMLFGLKLQYKNYIVDNYHARESAENIKLAYWMITQRRGAIFVETALLMPHLTFEIILTTDKQAGPFLQINQSLNCEQVPVITEALSSNAGNDLATQLSGSVLTIADTEYTLIAAGILSGQNLWFKQVLGTNYFFTVRLTEGGEIANPRTSALLNRKAVIVLPAFIPQFNTPAFKDRLNFFMYNTLPAQLGFDTIFASSTDLGNFLALYADWHNALIYKGKALAGSADDKPEIMAKALATLINDVNMQL